MSFFKLAFTKTSESLDFATNRTIGLYNRFPVDTRAPIRFTFTPNGKRQIQVKNCPEQFLCIKLA